MAFAALPEAQLPFPDAQSLPEASGSVRPGRVCKPMSRGPGPAHSCVAFGSNGAFFFLKAENLQLGQVFSGQPQSSLLPNVLRQVGHMTGRASSVGTEVCDPLCSGLPTLAACWNIPRGL